MALVPDPGKTQTVARMHSIHRRNGGREAHQIVELARSYSQAALRKMAKLMEGDGGKITTLDKNGTVVEIDVEVPAAVQLKAAETLVERGWGKAPIAVLLKGDSIIPGDERKTMTVAEKIVALSQAQNVGETRDLEASEIQEVEEIEVTIEEKREPVRVTEEAVSAADMI